MLQQTRGVPLQTIHISVNVLSPLAAIFGLSRRAWSGPPWATQTFEGEEK
jgi:hypothetical protein